MMTYSMGNLIDKDQNEVWVTDTTEVLYGVDKLKKAQSAYSSGFIWSLRVGLQYFRYRNCDLGN